MESKILGLPLILWMFLFLLAVSIDLPMLLLHNGEIKEIAKLSITPTVTSVPTLTLTPTASPSAAPTSAYKSVVPVHSVPTSSK